MEDRAARLAAGLDPDAVVRSTFLFTDGHANCGITESGAICSATLAMLDELSSCKSTISTFGFGQDHRAEMLQRIADAGEGSYSHVQSSEEPTWGPRSRPQEEGSFLPLPEATQHQF